MIYAGIISVCLVFYTIVYAATKNKKPFKRAFLSMLCGVVALILVDLAGIFLDIGLEISPFTLTVSACGGVPAVAAMLLINTVFF